MINEDREWLYSLITFTAGTSYNLGGVRFAKNIPKQVTSRAVRDAIDGVDGFQIGDVYEPETVLAPEPEVPVEEPEENEESEEVAPKVKVIKRKKTVRKKKVKTVNKGDE